MLDPTLGGSTVPHPYSDLGKQAMEAEERAWLAELRLAHPEALPARTQGASGT